MKDLVYIVNGKVIETIMSNKPSSLCYWKKNQLLSQPQYKLGLLSVVNSK